MKTKKIPLWMGLIFTTMFIANCAQSTENAATSPSATPFFPTSSATSSKSFMPLPTGESVATLTPIAAPTLPIEEAQTKLLQLLSNNGNCRLPCFWGITPGESSFHEAQAILVPLSSVSEFTAFETGIGSITPYFIEDGLKIYTTIDFVTKRDNNIINSIAFNAEAHSPLAEGGYEEVFDSQFFGEKISAYTLAHVLSEQGVPSAVLISTMAGPPTRGGKAGFYMLLLYPDQGILVSYTTNWINQRGNVLGCFSNAHVEMELYPSGQGDAFSELLAPTKWSGMWPVPVESPYWKPIEKATAMSLDQFYETFRQPTEKCIETPVSLWPTPEP